MAATSIEWTQETWNPTRGCSRVSPGCENCYAEREAARFCGSGGPYEGLVQLGPKGPRWTRRVRFIPEKLAEPLEWRKPKVVFVDSMSDLFHEDLTDREIAAVFGVMAAAKQHTFQILTKRSERAARWLSGDHDLVGAVCEALDRLEIQRGCGSCFDPDEWPLPNVWIGASIEDEPRAAERIPHLLRSPASRRFISYEPALGAVPWERWIQPRSIRRQRAGIDWLICGGESGPGARPCELGHLRSAIEACRRGGVPVFVKQLGSRPIESTRINVENIAHDFSLPAGASVKMRLLSMSMEQSESLSLRSRKGNAMDEWPADLRIREFPR